MRTRILALAAVATLGLPAVAQADDTTAGTSDTAAAAALTADPGTTTADTGGTTTPPEDPVIVAGVTVARVPVGGLTRSAALARLETRFGGPVGLRVGRKRYKISPAQLGVKVNLDAAVAKAVAATGPGNIVAPISYDKAKLAALEAWLIKKTRLPEQDAAWIVAARPKLRPEVIGAVLKQKKLHRALVLALQRPMTRGRARVIRDAVVPDVRNNEVGPYITISTEENALAFWLTTRKGKVVRARTFGVATGQSAYPTPHGPREIIEMWADPWWYPPNSSWAAGAQPIPPGPGNPLGTRWMGLGDAVGIHGTPDAASIGYSASHGCIRMQIPDAEWLFDHVSVGTPVYIH